MKRTAIGVDLGCTNIKAVLIDEGGHIYHQVRVETREQDDRHWKEAVKKIVNDLRSRGNRVDAVGLCAPGLANPVNTCIACMPGRLPGLENFDWSQFTGEKV